MIIYRSTVLSPATTLQNLFREEQVFIQANFRLIPELLFIFAALKTDTTKYTIYLLHNTFRRIIKSGSNFKDLKSRKVWNHTARI